MDIAAHHLWHLFERYFRAGKIDDASAALAIDERVCDHLGWKIEVRGIPGKGAAFTLVRA